MKSKATSEQGGVVVKITVPDWVIPGRQGGQKGSPRFQCGVRHTEVLTQKLADLIGSLFVLDHEEGCELMTAFEDALDQLLMVRRTFSAEDGMLRSPIGVGARGLGGDGRRMAEAVAQMLGIPLENIFSPEKPPLDFGSQRDPRR